MTDAENICDQRPEPATLVIAAPADPLEIIARAVERGFDADQLGKLMDLQERYEKRKAETAYWEAMSECQAEMPAIVKDKTNKDRGNKYASFEGLNKTIRPIYTRHGFSLTFTEQAGAPEGKIRIACDVGHRDGHHRQHMGDFSRAGVGLKGNPNMTAIEAEGATRSYGKRYLVKDIFNLSEAGEDNDGQDGAVVTPEQIETLNGLIAECQAITTIDLSKVWEWLDVEGMHALPARKFQKAADYFKGWLKKKTAAKGGAK